MKRQIRVILQLLIVLALSSCGRSPAKYVRLPDPKDVKAFLVQLVDVEKRAPGIVVGMIAADPQERWVVGYGRLSASDRRVPDGDTVFAIDSVTKVFTGTLLAQAVLNGEVQLDDPISVVLPEGVTAPAYEGRFITLRDLATHTAGFPRWPSNNSSRDHYFREYTTDQMYAYLSGYRLIRAPGSTYEYSNYGFGLLGNLLVRVAGQADYEALLLERITRPLGMDSTRIGPTADMRSRLAAPHSSYATQTINWDALSLAGCGLILSTANDLLTFLAANMGITDTALRPALQLAATPQRPGEMWTLAYVGLGWNLPGSGHGIRYHGGGGIGNSSFLAWDSERKIGVVVLMNVADAPKNRIAYPLLRGFPLTPVSVDPGVLASYAGRYAFDDFDVTIRVDGPHIYFVIPGSGEAELIAISEDRFYLADLYAEIAFYPNDRGEVDRMEAVVIGGTLVAKRVS